jgi:hydrogenase/urease accessory protein HupE
MGAYGPIARAHDARPLTVTLIEQGTDVYRVIVRAPPVLQAGNEPALAWPDHCEIRETAPLSLTAGSTALVACDGSLAGSDLSFRYPEYNPSLTTLVRLETRAGQSITAVLPPDRQSWTVPRDPNLIDVVLQYSGLGIEHILEGIDHLLFVAGLLLLARRPRKIVLAVTGFTLAHSITLAVAAFGLVVLPVSLVESLIALSVVFLAAEIVRDDPESFSRRYPIMLSFVFGLLHGFGFAFVLGELDLPTSTLVEGLLFFNVGVELGQLAFIAVCVVLWRAYVGWQGRYARERGRSGRRTTTLKPDAGIVSAYAIGIPSAFWFVERAAVLFIG